MAIPCSAATRCSAVRPEPSPESGEPSPESGEPSPSPAYIRRTRVVLPKGKAVKWSTGVAPGDYGGPPTTRKLRKYWGGAGDEDPVTATDDFIWNKDFLARMKRLYPMEPAAPLQSLKEPDSGFLSINRAMSLDSMEIDLSKELRPPSKPVLQLQVEAARHGGSALSSGPAALPRWRLAPTRREQEKWDRAAKATTWGSDVMLRESKRTPGDPKVLAAQAREQYMRLKQELKYLTLGIGGIGVASSYLSYSPEVTASFGAGFLGSLVYIRMLGNSVDSIAANGPRALIKGAVGQPRLLVPVALVMIYNRWNGILVPDYGFMHLELIPMLLGFFTYKAATFVQALQEALTIVSKRSEA